jgi:hypothetical protein
MFSKSLRKYTSKSTKTTFQNSTHSIHISLATRSTSKTQGIEGQAALIIGDFDAFTTADKQLISTAIDDENQALVIVNDKNTIATPANERARWIRKAFDGNQKVQVLVVYGAPALTSDLASVLSYSEHIKKNIPKVLDISGVYGRNDYSARLAYLLGTSHYRVTQTEETNTIINGNDSQKFTQAIDFPKAKDLTQSVETAKQRIEQLNANHPNKASFFTRMQWDMSKLNQINAPLIIETIRDEKEQKQFSALDNTQVYDMPIYAPGIGWRIPNALAAHAKLLEHMASAERAANPNVDNCFAYVTYDSGVVAPNHYARREGLHVDGFLSKANQIPEHDGKVYGDNTYLMCDDLGTELYPGPFDLSHINQNNATEVLSAFEAQGKGMAYMQAKPYTIYRLTVNDVHAVHPNDTGEYRQRNFIKVTFSVRPFNRLGSTINPLFNGLNWQYVPRDSSARNTQNYTGACPHGFTDAHISAIDFMAQKVPSWCGPFFNTRKKTNLVIQAKLAKQGEQLQTIVNGDLITTNFAGYGDMEVIRADEDRYYLPKDKFNRLYQVSEGENNFCPKARILDATHITIPISIIGMWGTRQNLPKGSTLVSDGKEVWGVHPRSFEETYSILSSNNQ